MANLTQGEFLAIADIYPSQINIWCTETTPVDVLGVTVPVLDNNGNNLSAVLGQAETINLPVDNQLNTSVQLRILTKTARTVANIQYYFFTTQQQNIDTFTDPVANESIANGEVIFLPELRGGNFTTSDYNILLNIAQINRTSEYLTELGSINKAAVQDSLYSDTGWTNARYNGTITNRNNYASIDSAIKGVSFEGTFYPITFSDSEIANIETANRTYTVYFHDGNKDYPEYVVDTENLFETANSVTSQETSFLVVPTTENLSKTKLYEQGDVLLVGSSTEILKVISIVRTTGNTHQLTVSRGWNNTPISATINSGIEFTRIGNTRVFELEQSKPSPVRQGKIRIKDTGNILFIDKAGYLISGSTPTI